MEYSLYCALSFSSVNGTSAAAQNYTLLMRNFRSVYWWKQPINSGTWSKFGRRRHFIARLCEKWRINDLVIKPPYVFFSARWRNIIVLSSILFFNHLVRPFSEVVKMLWDEIYERQSFGGAIVVVVTVPSRHAADRFNCLAITMLLQPYGDQKRCGTVSHTFPTAAWLLCG